MKVFGPRTDALIREIDSFTDDYGVYDPFEPVLQLILDACDDRRREPELYEALVRLRDDLRRERGGT